MRVVTVPGPFGAQKVLSALTCAHGPNFRVLFGPLVAFSLLKPCFDIVIVIFLASPSILWSMVGPSFFGVFTVSFFSLFTKVSAIS